MKRALAVAAISVTCALASTTLSAPAAMGSPGVNVDVYASSSGLNITDNVGGVDLRVLTNANGSTYSVTSNSGHVLFPFNIGPNICTGDGTPGGAGNAYYLSVTCNSSGIPLFLSVALKADSTGNKIEVKDDNAYDFASDIRGSNGSDILIGGGGDDTILGKDGNDTIDGGNGFDILMGGAGADSIVDTGADGKSADVRYFYEQTPGNPASDFDSFRTTGVNVTLDGVANDGSTQDGGSQDNVGTGIRFVTGTNFDDTIVGNSSDNTLDGLAGADTVTGGLGVDYLIGKAGSDTLNANDGVADYSIDCNNSDASRGSQPNTANVDALDPEPVDCSTVNRPSAAGGGGSGGGGSSSDSGGTTTYSTAQPVNTRARWTIPAGILPQPNPAIKDGYSFSSLDDVKDDLADVQLPIMVQVTRHPLSEVPAQYRAGIENGDIFDVDPAPGTEITGAFDSPTWVNLHTYVASEDPIPRGKRCPYQGKITWGYYNNQDIKGLFEWATLDEARSIAEDLKCDFEIVKYKNGSAFNLNQPVVGKVNVVRNKSAGKGRYVLEWTVFNPVATGLAVMLGPRNPKDWNTSPKRADDFDDELTLDTNMELHASTGKKISDTAIRVWVIDKSDGLFVGRANVEAWFDGEFLQSVDTNVASGGLTLNLKLRDSGMLTIAATYEDKFGNVTSGTRSIWVSSSDDVFVTADGRCFEQKNEKWVNGDCPSKGAEKRRWNASADALRDRFVAAGFTGANQLKDGDPIAALRKAAKELKIVPGMLGPGPATRNGVKPRMKGVFLDWIIEGVKSFFKRVSAVAFAGNRDTGEVAEVVQGAVETLSLPSANSAAVLALSEEQAYLTSDRGFVFQDAAVVNGDYAGLIAAGGQNLIAAGGQNLIAAGGQNLIAAGGQNLIAAGGQNLIAAGGQNMINREGGQLIAAGGQNLIAAGGQNLSPAVLSDKGAGEKDPDPNLKFEVPLSPLIAAGGLN